MAEFKAAYLSALYFVETQPCIRLFYTDQILIGAFDAQQEGWLVQEFYPKVQHIITEDIWAAVVFSEDHFKAIVSNYKVPSALPVQRFIHFNYFTNRQEAELWLKEMKKGQNLLVAMPGSDL
ncbi:hypothetical protein [Pontibacter oryzae]|nr:hypothetical protein [Pontibacter oryzae]